MSPAAELLTRVLAEVDLRFQHATDSHDALVAVWRVAKRHGESCGDLPCEDLRSIAEDLGVTGKGVKAVPG